MADKAPQTVALFHRLQAEKAQLLAILAPFRADYERLANDPRLIECRKVIKDAAPHLARLDNEIAALARAIGAKGLKIEAGEFSAKV